MTRFVDEARLVVCVGPGGVGKTTVAAATGVDAARRGRRAVVLTIDPAKRLANALGLDGLDDRLRRVPMRDGGDLRAAMLDTRASYDELMRRVGRDAESTSRILENRVYRAFSRTLARSHAYVAMERLHDLLHTEDVDFIVLDTPPTRTALDVLDAPGRLAQFLDDDVVRWFVAPRKRGPLSRLVPTGGAAVRRLLSLVASRKLVDELAEFFDTLLHLRQGFQQRASYVQRALRLESTAFVLVCAPEVATLEDAAYLRDGLQHRGVSIAAIVCNRGYVPEASTPAVVDRALAARLVEHRAALETAGLDHHAAEFLAEELDRLRRIVADDNARKADEIARFAANDRVVILPELERDVRDLNGLAELGTMID